MTRYFRTVIEVEVITADAPLDEDMQLDDIQTLLVGDNPSGRIVRWQEWEIQRDLAEALLRQQGTLPEAILGRDDTLDDLLDGMDDEQPVQ